MAVSIPRQISVRIGLLLAGLITILAGAGLGFALLERHFIREILMEEHAEHGRLLDGVLAVTGKPLRLFVEGYARRTTFTRPEDDKRGASAEATLATGLRMHELMAAWVVEADGRLRIHISAEGVPPRPPPLPAAQVAALQSSAVHFFMDDGGIRCEVRGGRLAPSGANPDAPRGWLFAARRLDPAALVDAGMPFDSQVTIVPADRASGTDRSARALRIVRLLRDFSGQPIMAVVLESVPPEIEILALMTRLSLAMLGVLGVGVIGLCGVCLWRWIVWPAAVLRRSLTDQNPALLQPLVRAGGDLGLLAELVRDSMDARRQLELTLEERARLSRDLHDGVIQTIYAAGMNVAGARALLASDPAAADARLERSCVALNATVHDVRNFIVGLESESTSARTFRQNVDFIVSLLRPLRPIEFNLEIDDERCVELTPEQRRHTLQIVREALSNCVRHSTATRVAVRIRAAADGTVIEVEDDGMGFEPDGSNEGGHGLRNLAARAAEIRGDLRIGKAEPQGTRVRLTLPAASATGGEPPLGRIA